MLLLAVAILGVPVYRQERRIPFSILVGVLVLLATAPALYLKIGTPSGAEAPELAPGIDDMVASLAARLEEDPDDLASWKMLGRSYFELGRYRESSEAFGKAVALESSNNGQTLADLGQSVLMDDPESIYSRAGQLFESALALSPANPKALFYGGMAAINRGDPLLGADRWEKLLATSPPPPNVEELLRSRIAILRGETPAEIPAEPQESAPVLKVRIELGDEVRPVVSGDASVFLIARDPGQPSPPIAAIRRKASELPADVSLSDSDAMIPGRVPSGFAELEIVARVSMSGDPIARSGDWFGVKRVRWDETDTVQIRIDQQVP